MDFIVGKVQLVVAASKGSLINGPNLARRASAAPEIARRMDSVLASLRRDLEIQIRRREALPKQAATRDATLINMTIRNAANVNLGSQLGTINATLTTISHQSDAHREISDVLSSFSKAVVASHQLLEAQKREVLEVLADVAKQVETEPEARSIGKLRAMIAGLPSLVGVAADLATLWDKCAPLIKHFFGI